MEQLPTQHSQEQLLTSAPTAMSQEATETGIQGEERCAWVWSGCLSILIPLKFYCSEKVIGPVVQTLFCFITTGRKITSHLMKQQQELANVHLMLLCLIGHSHLEQLQWVQLLCVLQACMVKFLHV